MTHYRLQGENPSGIILIKNPMTSSLDELKLYNENTFYLNDGNEFQIRLFNPLMEKIGVQIGFNGETQSSYLVLNPGEDIILDRFLDVNKKMLFETYQYDSNNSVAQNAVALNGLLNIKFFKEKKQDYIPYSGTIKTNIVYDNSGAKFDMLNMNIGTCKSVNTYNSVTMDNLVLDSGSNGYATRGINSTFTSSVNNVNTVNTVNTKSYQPKRSRIMKETGRISRGTQSNQNFVKIEVDFDILPFYELNYYLKPVSEKGEYEIKEYCTNCSTRIRKKTWLYCPKCGNKL